MPRFTTRVQLYGDPEWRDYERLHIAMKGKGFTQAIKNGDGVEYSLPHAEYNREANVTRDQVLKDAKEAAAPVWDHFCVLVTESAGRTWHNLKVVK
jgi:hypothetical protein